MDAKRERPVCAICGGRGLIDEKDELGYTRSRLCECMEREKSLRRIRKSGLSDLLDAYTFDAFLTPKPWQKAAKDKAMAFTKDFTGHWFFIGGQVGAGKTHLCTAIVGTFLKAGYDARYMLWRNEMSDLKALRFDKRGYNQRKDRWVDTPVLYVDDLYKTGSLDDFEKDVTFEILNARYNRKKDVTILSCEKTMREILLVDEAVGSRIYERAREYGVTIDKDMRNNYRVYGARTARERASE